MDATLKRIAALASGADAETRCAALLVLTRLGSAEEGVVREVVKCVGSKNTVVRDFGLSYLAEVKPRSALPHLLPLLDSEELPVRERVASILIGYGPAAIAELRKLVSGAPRRRLHAIIEVCAGVRTKAALDLLFDLMRGDDVDLNRAACNAVVALLPRAAAPLRAEVFARADRLCSASAAQPALVAAAKLFGALGDPGARRRLFAMLQPQHPQIVRTHALAAAASCLRDQKLATTEIDALLSLLDSDDENGILRPAVRLLEEQPLDRSYLATLNRLAESPQPLVKRFAVQKLGAFESGAVIRTLIGYLTDDSYARRDQAASSLKSLPAARTALMNELLACDDERKAWTLVDILLSHDRAWKRATLAALYKRLDHAVTRRQDRLHTAYFHLLGVLAPEQAAAHVRAQAEKARKKRDFSLSARWLALLKGGPAFDAETRYAYALSELKSHKHALAAPGRRHDPALELLRELIHSPFPATERLRKERAVTPEDLFYVGFHLAEGSPDDKEAARELMAHLAAKVGRTRVGKAAKNKLRLLARAA